ncbi:glycosyltransferase [Geobacillus stearothermophilus]|nr:glycosyltransferase [Geobacillus stearothermophilus]
MKVAVCVCTYKRPQYLDVLLTALSKQKNINNANLVVIVVDNDVNKTAFDTVAKHREFNILDIRYHVEPQKGISYARNKCVEKALELNVENVAFIDDDEIPCEIWLSSLLETKYESRADIIGGPVISQFTEEIPDWILKGGFFNRPNYICITGNSLISSSVLKKFKKPFSEKYALSGGEDTHFFLSIKKMGCKTAWSKNAIVNEVVPVSRTNVKWILKRAFRTGCTASMIEIDLNGRKVIFKRLIIASVRFLQGIFTLIISFLGKHKFVKSLWYFMKGFGVLYGIMGGQYKEYHRVHGK